MPNFTWYGHPLYRYKDNDNGRFISRQKILSWQQEGIDVGVEQAKSFAEPVATGEITVGRWQTTMRALIKKNAIQQAILGAGGREQMTQADWGMVGGVIADQYRYLDNFAQQIADGELSSAQIAARSAMYIRSTKEAFERMQSRIRGLPMMPAYSGDGSTICLTNCACAWEYVWKPSANKWYCYWRLSPAEHCETCLERAEKWNPLIMDQTQDTR